MCSVCYFPPQTAPFFLLVPLRAAPTFTCSSMALSSGHAVRMSVVPSCNDDACSSATVMPSCNGDACSSTTVMPSCSSCCKILADLYELSYVVLIKIAWYKCFNPFFVAVCPPNVYGIYVYQRGRRSWGTILTGKKNISQTAASSLWKDCSFCRPSLLKACVVEHTFRHLIFTKLSEYKGIYRTNHPYEWSG